MGWTWRYADPSGGQLDDVTPTSPSFPTQADAESWLGETWRELGESGVDSVTLLEDGVTVYGPMSLRPDGS